MSGCMIDCTPTVYEFAVTVDYALTINECVENDWLKPYQWLWIPFGNFRTLCVYFEQSFLLHYVSLLFLYSAATWAFWFLIFVCGWDGWLDNYHIWVYGTRWILLYMIVGSRLIVTLPFPMRTLYTWISVWGIVHCILTEYECVFDCTLSVY